jgi:AraC-like DNA-binding protein
MGPNMRVLSSYTFVYTLEGNASYQNLSGLQRDIGPGDLIFVFPNQPHNYNPKPNTQWKQIYFMVDSPMVSLWQETGYLDPARPIHHAEPVEYWFKKFHEVYIGYQHYHSSGEVLAVLQVQQLLAEILFAEESDLVSKCDLLWADKACELLGKYALHRTSVQMIAEKMDMSYECFRKRFTRILGVSPTQYQNRQVIDQACRLMQGTNLSNKEIAYRLGFCDEFHFSHRFKQITGRSPREFRRTLPVRIK